MASLFQCLNILVPTQVRPRDGFIRRGVPVVQRSKRYPLGGGRGAARVSLRRGLNTMRTRWRGCGSSQDAFYDLWSRSRGVEKGRPSLPRMLAARAPAQLAPPASQHDDSSLLRALKPANLGRGYRGVPARRVPHALRLSRPLDRPSAGDLRYVVLRHRLPSRVPPLRLTRTAAIVKT